MSQRRFTLMGTMGTPLGTFYLRNRYADTIIRLLCLAGFLFEPLTEDEYSVTPDPKDDSLQVIRNAKTGNVLYLLKLEEEPF